MTESALAAVVSDVLAETRASGFCDQLTELLLEICRIDTTPNADVGVMRDAESAVFNILERELEQVEFPTCQRERRPINPEIAAHPAYSQLHFTKTEERPEGLCPVAVYGERSNLLYFVPGAGPADRPHSGVAVNAHIDVVHPYFPPRLEDGIVYGRGSCDDKGGIVGMLVALQILSRVLAKHGLRFRDNVVAMFVVEEETGGNGSLSLAIDRELKKLYDSVLVLEITDNKLHPANRGAVWYRAELALPGVSLFEMSAFVYEELEKEGRSIRAESRHALFPQRPVQTCHGMIGPYGEHPSRICGEVSFDLVLGAEPTDMVEDLVRDCIAFAVDEYIGVYGDKTKEIDSGTGQPKVDHHYDLSRTADGFRIDVHGSTGHMGAILENDGAITKMACMVRALARSRAAIEATGGDELSFSLVGHEDKSRLVLEGGQGFVPTHDITAVMPRMERAAQVGAENYLRMVGRSEQGSDVVQVTYEKLHNAAFDGDPSSEPMQNAIAAATTCGTWDDEPI
ncbi:MAG: M20/M25/M40 family metallo-hydrolase, partial [Lentisphaerae bacterium]|nr:M20/M25/M40 family metallo-hydrolase [Lentisphaerota bacterium]